MKTDMRRTSSCDAEDSLLEDYDIKPMEKRQKSHFIFSQREWALMLISFAISATMTLSAREAFRSTPEKNAGTDINHIVPQCKCKVQHKTTR